MNTGEPERVERRLTAILAADVAGYSRLMGVDEEGTLAALKATRRELVDPRIVEHRGRIVKTTGDGLLVEFASVVDAVRCAVDVQREMAARNANVSAETRIEFRVGINLGDIIIDGDDIFGDGVNIAARLETLADPGGICVSRVVRDQVRDKLDIAFEDMGEQQVKNIARPVHAYAVSMGTALIASIVAAPSQARPPRPVRPLHAVVIATSVVAVIGIVIGGWWAWPRGGAALTASVPAQTAAAPLLSIVVLPFANLSNDPEQEYFADAITEDVTTDLSRISDSFVIARNTAFSYKGKSVDVKQLGRELGIRYVLEGSVRRLGDQVQVNVQLIDAEGGAHLWADRFETDRRNLAQAQREITGRLARTLNLQLVAAAGRRIELEKAADPDVRDLVMRGRALQLRPFSVATRQEALRAFERALAIDPGAVDPKIGIAGILVSTVATRSSNSVQQDEARAEQLLTEALDRDTSNAGAHFSMGYLRRLQNRLPESKIELETAAALDRNFANAFTQLGNTLTFMGQPDMAIPLEEKAIRLNPHDPNIQAADWALGHSHLLLGHVDEAIDLLRKARAANPRLFYIQFTLAAALGLKGEIDEAHATLAEALKLNSQLNTLAKYRTGCTFCGNPQFRALAEKTIVVGLSAAGLPDE